MTYLLQSIKNLTMKNHRGPDQQKPPAKQASKPTAGPQRGSLSQGQECGFALGDTFSTFSASDSLQGTSENHPHPLCRASGLLEVNNSELRPPPPSAC